MTVRSPEFMFILRFQALVGLSSFLCLASQGGAALLFSEDFDNLSLGELNGQGGSTGITGTWQAQIAITEVTNAPQNFSVTLPTGEVISGGTQSLEVNGNNNNAISAALAVTQTEDFYAAFLVQMESGTISSNDFATFWFGEGSYVGSPAIGIKAELGLDQTDLMGRISGQQEAYAEEQLAIGDTYYLVAKISKTGGSTTYNQVDFWVNPGTDQEANPEATSTGTIAFEEFQSLGIRSVNLTTGSDNVYFDNLVVATEWDDLFPVVPEPTGFVLFSVGLCLECFRRRRPLS